jgi:hypothetical protein
MDLPDHQGAGDHEDVSWMQPAIHLEDDIFMLTNPCEKQAENGLWNPRSYFNVNDNFPSVLMNQPAAGRDWTPQTPLNHINNPTANWADPGWYTPRFIHPFPVPDSNIEPQHPPNMSLPEGGQDEPEYTHAGMAHVTKRARINSGLSSEEWEKWKPEIKSLYFRLGSTLEDTRTEMANKGFHAGSVTLLSSSLRRLC